MPALPNEPPNASHWPLPLLKRATRMSLWLPSWSAVQATTGAPVPSITMAGAKAALTPGATPAPSALPLALPASWAQAPPTSRDTSTCGLPLRVSVKAT